MKPTQEVSVIDDAEQLKQFRRKTPTINNLRDLAQAGSRPTDENLLAIYRSVTLIRQNNDRAISVLKAGRLNMPYSLRGQEIIPSAISVLLRDDDYIATISRGTHDILAKGTPLRELWAEIAGKATGACNGNGWPMHLTYPTMELC
jgi:TPP-dependent pyruvate/acetoin dehydrogenase alpha subunit